MFYLQKDNIYAVPVIHYKMEMAAHVKKVFDHLKPDCVAVELAETMQPQLLHAASRLPDISIIAAQTADQNPLYYMCEPCDPSFEALRSALETNTNSYCIDLDVDYYPDINDPIPDCYAINRIGLKAYYELFSAYPKKTDSIDTDRELHMARRLKELSLRHSKVLFVGGMAHIERILKLTEKKSFPLLMHAKRDFVQLCALTEDSCRNVMAEYGWISKAYEELRQTSAKSQTPDRQKLIFQLYKRASEQYIEKTGNSFPGYNLRNTMKFVRNYALMSGQLMPDLFQILTAAKGCVDHNYAYEVWDLATSYPYRRNVDALPELDLSIEDVWKHSKIIQFHLKEKSRKNTFFERQRKDRSSVRFKAPGPFTICSYPPEDLIIERFGDFLKKKGTQLFVEDSGHIAPFTTSLEDGIDARESIRHWHEKKLYVKIRGKPPGGVGSVCVIFDEDKLEPAKKEKFPWYMTWIGEHQQESDMAFYATHTSSHVVGPGISRCEYGGFMMSSPPRRMFDIWSDPDYRECRNKAEVLLMASIDYAVKPIVVYVAASPPRSFFKSFARRFGKKIIYIPIGQLSPITLNKLRVFHVLDGHNKRTIADEYIY